MTGDNLKGALTSQVQAGEDGQDSLRKVEKDASESEAIIISLFSLFI